MQLERTVSRTTKVAPLSYEMANWQWPPWWVAEPSRVTRNRLPAVITEVLAPGGWFGEEKANAKDLSSLPQCPDFFRSRCSLSHLSSTREWPCASERVDQVVIHGAFLPTENGRREGKK